MISVVCPVPACRTTFELQGLIDLGYLAEQGFPAGFTEATLGVDCPACAVHLDFHLPVEWRQGTS